MRWVWCLVLALLWQPVYGQADDAFVEGILFDSSTSQLGTAIRSAAGNQARYSYNIANLSTPGFNPILSAEEEAELARLIPDTDLVNKQRIINEYMMTKMTLNRSRYGAYINLMKKKMEITRGVVSMGRR